MSRAPSKKVKPDPRYTSIIQKGDTRFLAHTSADKIRSNIEIVDVVLDPFNGSGTTGSVAIKHHPGIYRLRIESEIYRTYQTKIVKDSTRFTDGGPKKQAPS